MTPIRPEMRSRYPVNWDAISYRIRFDSAKGQCECTGQCGLHETRRCSERHFAPATFARGKIILTVAHLDHEPSHCNDNLLAMCQRCHLRYDRDHHAETRRG